MLNMLILLLSIARDGFFLGMKTWCGVAVVVNRWSLGLRLMILHHSVVTSCPHVLLSC
jgi:hypothetical protein